jgi:hypothetical protein
MHRAITYLFLLAAVLAGPLAAPADAAAHKPLVPNQLQLLMMIKSTLIAFNQANETGNYTVLRDLAAPTFQEVNTSARLGEIFQKERNKKLDLTPVLLLQPQLLKKPQVDDRGLLRLEGVFPSKPEMVHFTLIFQDVQAKWRIVALGVDTFSAAPPVASRINNAVSLINQQNPAVTADEFMRRNWWGVPNLLTTAQR